MTAEFEPLALRRETVKMTQNCTIESLDANILRIVCDCSDVGAEESNVHIKRSHHDIVLLGLFHQAQVLV